MTISISNPTQSTIIFISLFILAVLLFVRKKSNKEFFSVFTSQEVKGLAIFAIVFSHIGYFLVSDHRFLFPLTILAGVGVDSFLFLSGYGLTTSVLKKGDTILQFYKHRVLKLMIPFWIVLFSFLVLDYFVLGITYSWNFISKAIFGIFLQADIYQNLNSPFWYFTLILFYYLLFPLVFSKKRPWLSALILLGIPYLVIFSDPKWFQGVIGLHRVHTFAFPLGIIFANLVSQIKNSESNLVYNIKNKFQNFPKYIKKIFYYLSLLIALFVFIYFSYKSGVGKGPSIEQTISLITMFALVTLFLMKKFENKLFYILGIYSYEIYLIHWPIMYRYDFLYRNIPAWLATFLYLALFVVVSLILKKISERLNKLLRI